MLRANMVASSNGSQNQVVVQPSVGPAISNPLASTAITTPTESVQNANPSAASNKAYYART